MNKNDNINAPKKPIDKPRTDNIYFRLSSFQFKNWYFNVSRAVSSVEIEFLIYLKWNLLKWRPAYMEAILALTMAQTILEQVGNVRIVNLVNHKITMITEPILKASLHGILTIFGQANNKKLESQICEVFAMSEDIAEMKETLNKVVDQVKFLFLLVHSWNTFKTFA